jgi:hypothetical protein
LPNSLVTADRKIRNSSFGMGEETFIVAQCVHLGTAGGDKGMSKAPPSRVPRATKAVIRGARPKAEPTTAPQRPSRAALRAASSG